MVAGGWTGSCEEVSTVHLKYGCFRMFIKYICAKCEVEEGAS